MKHVRKVLVVGVAVIALLAGFGWANRPDGPPNGPQQVLSLKPPSFLSTAHAQEDVASFLDEEAGISAYTEVAGSLDLEQIEPGFRTIEYETSEYIIGSVALPDYQETHDAHCYVHTNGWVVCYYLAGDETAKILDLDHYDGVAIASTKLEEAIAKLLLLVGVVSFDTDYYHFQYPDATDLMLIAEKYGGEENSFFDVLLPEEYEFKEQSWILTLCSAYSGTDTARLYINDLEVSVLAYSNTDCHTALGTRTLSQLPGVYHNVRVTLANVYTGGTAYCGMAFVYKEVP